MTPKFKIGDIIVWDRPDDTRALIIGMDYKDYFYVFLRNNKNPGAVGLNGSWSIKAIDNICFKLYNTCKIWRDLNDQENNI